MPNKNITCSSCGTINDSKNKFCKKCGASLKNNKVKCPNCGAMNDSNDSFCVECGTPLKKEKVVNSTVKNNFIKNNAGHFNIRFIAFALMFIAVILAFIGIFGDVTIYTQTSSGLTAFRGTNSLSFFFKDAWEGLKNLKAIFSEQHLTDAYGQAVFEIVVWFISFLLAFVGVIAFTAYFIYHFYKSVTAKKELPIAKFFKTLVKIIAPYLILTSFFEISSAETISSDLRYSSSAAEKFGWGSILLIISIFMAFASYFIYELEKSNKNKRMSFCFSNVTTILMFFAIIFGLNNTAHSTVSDSYETYSRSSSIFIEYFRALQIEKGSTSGALYISSGTRTLFIFCIILMFVLMILVLANILAENISSRITLSVFIIVVAIIAGVLSSNAVNNFVKDCGGTPKGIDGLSPGFIIDIVFGAVSTASLIFASSIENRNQTQK